MVSIRAHARARASNKHKTAHNCRARVQAAIDSSSGQLTGHQLAAITGLTYRQTVDALTALHRQGRIERYGRKFTASWGQLTPKHDPMTALEAIWRQK